MNKRNVVSIVIYIFAGLLAVYSVWSLINSASVISEAVGAGQITIWGNLYDVISFYMANCVQYFVYALFLFALGILTKTKPLATSEVSAHTSSENINAENADIDSWFEEANEDKNRKAED